MAETVAILNAEMRGKLDNLDRDLKKGERMVKDTAGKMEKSLKKGVSFGESLEKLGRGLVILQTISSGVELAMDGAAAAAALLRGDVEATSKALDKFSKTAQRTPIFGGFFGLGKKIGEGIFGDQADADAINAQVEKDRERNEKIAAETRARNAAIEAELRRGASTAEGLARELRLTGKEGTDRLREKAAIDFEQAIEQVESLRAQIKSIPVGAAGNQVDRLTSQADALESLARRLRNRRLRVARDLDAQQALAIEAPPVRQFPKFAQELGISLANVSFSKQVAPRERPADKEGQERIVNTLANILTAVRAQRGAAFN